MFKITHEMFANYWKQFNSNMRWMQKRFVSKSKKQKKQNDNVEKER